MQVVLAAPHQRCRQLLATPMASTKPALTNSQATALRNSNYPCPPGYLCPPGWSVSVGGVPVAPVPQGADRRVAITHSFFYQLTEQQRTAPYWDPNNTTTWDLFFTERRHSELGRYEGTGPPPLDNNEAGRRLWWSGRTLADVMEHIKEGDFPRLRYPHIEPTAANAGQPCTLCGHRSTPPLPPRRQASPRDRFQPRPASDGSDSSEPDDYEYMYYTPRQEYD